MRESVVLHFADSMKFHVHLRSGSFPGSSSRWYVLFRLSTYPGVHTYCKSTARPAGTSGRFASPPIPMYTLAVGSGIFVSTSHEAVFFAPLPSNVMLGKTKREDIWFIEFKLLLNVLEKQKFLEGLSNQA